MGAVATRDDYPPCAKFVVEQGRGDPWHPHSAREVPPVVATFCGYCRRREACLSEALSHPEAFGIWAGLPPVILRRLRQLVAIRRDPRAVVREGLDLADRIRNTPGGL
jgi:hypothetical protein